MMSSDSFAYSIQADTGGRGLSIRGEVEKQSKETTSTPPPHVSKQHHSSTNLDLFRLKRHRSNMHKSANSPAVDRISKAGPALPNLYFLKTDASISAKFELSNVPEKKFILATPNQLSVEIQHPAVKRPRALSMFRNESSSMGSRVFSNDEILPENWHGSISSMFIPIHDGGKEGGLSGEEGSTMNGKYILKMKPRKLAALTWPNDDCIVFPCGPETSPGNDLHRLNK
jgi:hypothetical protein